MKPPIAIILAAGRCSRIAGQIAEPHKCLIAFGGEPLIVRSIRLILHHVERVIVVIGHAADDVREAIGRSPEAKYVDFVYAPDFAENGSINSFLHASKNHNGPAYILEADLLYHSAYITTITRKNSAICCANISGSGDEVFVFKSADFRLKAMGKRMKCPPLLQQAGELAGITYLTEDVFAELVNVAKNNPKWDYEAGLLVCAENGRVIEVITSEALPWTEIDNVSDLKRARDNVWPALQECGDA